MTIKQPATMNTAATPFTNKAIAAATTDELLTGIAWRH
jgi:hypothetical protein